MVDGVRGPNALFSVVVASKLALARVPPLPMVVPTVWVRTLSHAMYHPVRSMVVGLNGRCALRAVVMAAAFAHARIPLRLMVVRIVSVWILKFAISNHAMVDPVVEVKAKVDPEVKVDLVRVDPVRVVLVALWMVDGRIGPLVMPPVATVFKPVVVTARCRSMAVSIALVFSLSRAICNPAVAFGALTPHLLLCLRPKNRTRQAPITSRPKTSWLVLSFT